MAGKTTVSTYQRKTEAVRVAALQELERAAMEMDSGSESEEPDFETVMAEVKREIDEYQRGLITGDLEVKSDIKLLDAPAKIDSSCRTRLPSDSSCGVESDSELESNIKLPVAPTKSVASKAPVCKPPKLSQGGKDDPTRIRREELRHRLSARIKQERLGRSRISAAEDFAFVLVVNGLVFTK